jgi:hypothetical protein
LPTRESARPGFTKSREWEYRLHFSLRDDDGRASEHTNVPDADNSKQRDNTMGDRSPKANQKKSNQKQTKTSTADQKKKQAMASKQAAGQKK